MTWTPQPGELVLVEGWDGLVVIMDPSSEPDFPEVLVIPEEYPQRFAVDRMTPTGYSAVPMGGIPPWMEEVEAVMDDASGFVVTDLYRLSPPPSPSPSEEQTNG